MRLNLPNDIEEKIKLYRNQRREESDKVLFRDSAIVELLRKALDGIEKPMPLSDRVLKIEHRLDALERQAQ